MALNPDLKSAATIKAYNCFQQRVDILPFILTILFNARIYTRVHVKLTVGDFQRLNVLEDLLLVLGAIVFAKLGPHAQKNLVIISNLGCLEVSHGSHDVQTYGPNSYADIETMNLKLQK